jgi:uncharacterized membrane protein YeaQ/YmgE (transglycosylase-associated protein family)
MAFIAWILLFLVAGVLAKMLFPEKSPGIVITFLLGICGALLGGWLATKLFHLHTLNGFFNLSTWLTAIAGAGVLLIGYQLATGRSGHQAVRR